MRFVPLAAIFALLFMAGHAPAQETPPSLMVTGEGRVSAPPDMARVTVGATAEDESAAAAMRAVSDIVTRLLASLDTAGIAPEDVQTETVSLDPRWHHDRDGSAPQITGYIASNTLSVRVRDLDALGGVLDRLLSDGANRLQGLSFDIADPAPLMDEARRNAVRDARRRAETLAKAAGVRLGRILSLRDGVVTGPPQPAPMMRQMAMEDASVLPVAGGELDLSALVTIIWEIEE